MARSNSARAKPHRDDPCPIRRVFLEELRTWVFVLVVLLFYAYIL